MVSWQKVVRKLQNEYESKREASQQLLVLEMYAMGHPDIYITLHKTKNPLGPFEQRGPHVDFLHLILSSKFILDLD
ncbi:hypothetical protein CCACVL1_25564 [Corchorus capsularis]|uniref:Uncharacterized protein n=1 Tax=Corchorus capsularis TaxID=210143 RepID=A0A1R3GJD7_COCAP|nr:hypothetical protein CCACVL1_25564 [Corchorus capsularis]